MITTVSKKQIHHLSIQPLQIHHLLHMLHPIPTSNDPSCHPSIDPSIEPCIDSSHREVFNHLSPLGASNTFSHNAQHHQSEVHRLISQHHTQIRRNYIHALQSDARRKMLTHQSITRLFEECPSEIEQACSWARTVAMQLSSSKQFLLSMEQVLEVFKLAQKSQSLETLKLLLLVVQQADVEAIYSIFRYDVMKLLHTIIVYSCRKSLETPKYCQNMHLNFQDLRLNSSKLRKAQSYQSSSPSGQQFARVDLVKVSMRIICALCRKADYIRDFAVVSHKSYTYCFKAYQQFGSELTQQFLTFIEAATNLSFKHYDEQSQRIAGKILSLFSSKLKTEITFEDRFSRCDELNLIIQSVRNLLRMKQRWLVSMLKEGLGKACVLGGIEGMIDQAMMHLHYPSSSKFLDTLLSFLMHYIECCCVDLSQGDSIQLKLMDLLRVCARQEYLNQYVHARKAIYFLLANNICERSPTQAQILHSMASEKDGHLVSLLLRMLSLETNSDNIYEVAYLLSSIMAEAPHDVIEGLIWETGIIEIFLEYVTTCDSLEGEEANGVSTKGLMVEAIQMWLRSAPGSYHAQYIISQQSRLDAFCNVCKGQLVNKIERMIDACH